ncbi:MAG TPA: hypothetical protein V6D20_24700, partial [Candidatus Obscuribacterales bacterium]
SSEEHEASVAFWSANALVDDGACPLGPAVEVGNYWGPLPKKFREDTLEAFIDEMDNGSVKP